MNTITNINSPADSALKKVLEIGVLLSSERNIHRLLEEILSGVMG